MSPVSGVGGGEGSQRMGFLTVLKKTTGLFLFTVSRKTGSGFVLGSEASPFSVRGAGTRSAGGMRSLSSADSEKHTCELTAAAFKCSCETLDSNCGV